MTILQQVLIVFLVTTAAAQIGDECRDTATGKHFCKTVKLLHFCKHQSHALQCQKTCESCPTTTGCRDLKENCKVTKLLHLCKHQSHASQCQKTCESCPTTTVAMTTVPTTTTTSTTPVPKTSKQEPSTTTKIMTPQSSTATMVTTVPAAKQLWTTKTQTPVRPTTKALPTVTMVTPTTQPPISCHNTDPTKCVVWFAMGLCKDKDIGNMVRRTCPQNCGLCKVATRKDSCPNHLACDKAECLPQGLVCDGVYDCWNFADEKNCTTTKPPKCVLPATLLKNGDRAMSRNKHGDLIVKYQCQPGHILVGPTVRTCVLSTSVWDSHSEPQCLSEKTGTLFDWKENNSL